MYLVRMGKGDVNPCCISTLSLFLARILSYSLDSAIALLRRIAFSLSDFVFGISIAAEG